ncbi:hypothetical protein CBW56_16655 [Denitratisoma oestradiolicum]|nr:hypothetical protein CBW56_16655 [Denitratisoma oestradiolicum]
MSDDDMTILYCNVMESRRVEDKAYVAKQLISFHRYARSEFGIADPDWAELPEFQAATPAAPCVIAEHEYQEALRQLFHDSGTLMHLRFARCLALLCGYRFALRPGESWGLLRRDWIHTDNEIIVLVRDNRHRTIKTRAGRRQVPLLFPLSPLEKQIVEQWQLELESQFGIDDRGPLFFDEKNPSQPIDREQLLRPINQVLKRVTGNPDVSLHDARHSAACNTALLLNEKALPGWQSFFENDGRVDIERELLGTRGPTRRKSWALARYVGHSHPSTTFGNYIHFLDGWLEQRLELNPGPRPLKPPAHLVDLDALPVRESTQSLAAPDLSEACTPAQVLRYARLLSRGLDPERAAAAQGVSQPIAKDVWHLLMTLSQRGKFSRTAMGEGPQSNRRPLEFIQRIRDNAWKRLLDVASEINAATTSALSNIAVDELCVMLSSRWQFVVWQPHQLAAAREIADQLATHDGHRYYRMLATIGCSKDLKEAAQIYGFELESIDVATGRGSQVQLGTVDLQGGIYRVDQRCALIFLENKFAPVRNAMELFLMAIALWAAGRKGLPSSPLN